MAEQGYWYRYAQERLYRKGKVNAVGESVLSLREVRSILGSLFHLPAEVQQEIIEEMMVLGILRRVNQRKVAVRKF